MTNLVFTFCFLNTNSNKRNQSSLEECLIPGVQKAKHKINQEHLVPESKKARKGWGKIKGQRPARKSY